jgi:hypothetical protein
MVPPELLNNFAVMLMDADRNTEAKRILDEALTNCEVLKKAHGADDLRLKALTITTKFNFACCLESDNNIGDASEIFKAITQEEPSY